MARTGKPHDDHLFEAAGGPALLAHLNNVTHQIRLLEAQRLETVAELDRLGIAGLAGYPSTRALLVDTLRVTPTLASKLVSRAMAVTETLTPTGHLTPAPLPTVRAAVHDGAVDGEHIDAVARTVAGIPDTADVATRELVETTLGETARTVNPRVVRDHGDILLAHLNPDGPEPHDRPARTNLFSYTRGRDGWMRFQGQLGPEPAELLQQMLDQAGPAEDRSHTERLGDVLAEVVHRAANPTGGGTRARITVVMNVNTLLEGLGTATLDSGCPLSAGAVRRLSCDAEILPVVLNSQSVVLDVGRSRRLVKPAQRAALVARDRGCAFPGCPNPARWADAHHLVHWKDGGLTNLDNLVLLCRRHHTLLHDSPWQVRITDGLPEFVPPKWIDLHQRPRRNTLHLRQ